MFTACHIHNRITSTKTHVSPYEIWKGRKPNLSYLRVWGCVAFYKALDPKRSKLGPRGIKSIFVGYAENSKAYMLLNLDSNTIVESRDVEFIENKFYNDYSISGKENGQTSFSNPATNFSQGEKRKQSETVIEPRKSQRVRKEKTLALILFHLNLLYF